MASLNKVLLIGNLTRDPELRYTPQGTAVVNIGLAVNRRWKDKTGQQKEDVCFITVVAWDKQAEVCNQYLHKGKPIFVEGRLQFRSWQDNAGAKRSTIEVRAERIQFLGAPQAAGEHAPAGVQDAVPEADMNNNAAPAAADDISWMEGEDKGVDG